MELEGHWRAAESNDDLRRAMATPGFDDSGWDSICVPGHWRSIPAFESSDGPVLYRRRFEWDPHAEKRCFLTFDGIFYQGDVWLDGEYVGDTEGYFAPHTFEITGAARARREHVLAVEVACQPPADRKSKKNLTGVFQHWDCIDPAWNPGGIWASVRLEQTGAVRIKMLKVLCRDATPEAATLDIEAEMDTFTPGPATVVTSVRRDGAPVAAHEQQQALATGINRVHWRVTVEGPELWWPWSLGDQPLYEVTVEVRDGDAGAEASDRRVLMTGLRQVRVANFIATVNGERMFLKGINAGPTRRALAEATPAEVAADVGLARDAGLDLIRVHAHIGRPELYQAADVAGMLLWQDLPLQWGYGQVRGQAVTQARQAVALLGHHPSIALWCGHNEPMAVDIGPGNALAPKTVARVVAAQVLPSWNKTVLDRSIRRALSRADGTREVVAHSGIVPHPAWGTDSHFYFGWYHGGERDLPGALARLPTLARFVSEFGAQAVPNSAEFMRPERWPVLDWEHLEAHHCLQRQIFDQRIPPEEYETFDAWRLATQEYQATLLRFHIETLRRLKYRPTGGFCVFLLADAQAAVTWSILDHQRSAKLGYQSVADACAPVIITADRPAAGYRRGDRIRLGIHAVSDLRRVLTGAEARAVVSWPGGRRTWRFEGDVGADSCSLIGRIDLVLPPAAGPGEIGVELTLSWPGGEATNRYTSRVL